MITKERVLEEIEALQKQSQELYANMHKVEGALQFAHHVLSLVEGAAAEAAVIQKDVAKKDAVKPA